MRITDALDTVEHCVCGRHAEDKYGWVQLFYHLDEGALTDTEAARVLKVVRDLEGHRLCWRDLVAFLKMLDLFYAVLEQDHSSEALIALLNNYMDARQQGATCQKSTSLGTAPSPSMGDQSPS